MTAHQIVTWATRFKDSHLFMAMILRNKVVLVLILVALAASWIWFATAHHMPGESYEPIPSPVHSDSPDFSSSGSSVVPVTEPAREEPRIPTPQSSGPAFRFIGTVLSLESQNDGQRISKVSQEPYQPYSKEGLANGHKGDVTILHRSCSLKMSGKYSFQVLYDASTDVYLCQDANLVFYD